MVNLTKKTPCSRRNDLIYAYAKEGKWEGEDGFISHWDAKAKIVTIHYWWDWECFDGNVDYCTPGDTNWGNVTASG